MIRVVPPLLRDLSDRSRKPSHGYELARSADHGSFTISVDDRELRTVGSALALVDELLWHVNHEAILLGGANIAIHASAVAWHGFGLLFPGSAGSGKTTLAAALLDAGARYLTDEAALIDPATLMMHPYPKPMWMSPRSIRAIDGLAHRLLPDYRSLSRARIYASPRDLGTGVAVAPLAVSHVIAPTYRPRMATSLEAISPAAGLMALSRNAFDLDRFRGEGVEVLGRVASSAPCSRLLIGDVGEAVRSVEALLATRASGGDGTER